MTIAEFSEAEGFGTEELAELDKVALVALFGTCSHLDVGQAIRIEVLRRRETQLVHQAYRVC